MPSWAQETVMADQPHEVAELAQKMLKAAGTQNPVTLMKALLLCMQLVDATTPRPKKAGQVPNAEGNPPAACGRSG